MGDYLLIPSAILVYFLIKYYCFAINHDSEHFEYIFLNDGYDNEIDTEINNELDNEINNENNENTENTEIVPPKYESIVSDLPSYSENNNENNSETNN